MAAIELNRKSQMVSEAVEEVLKLVQNATQTFKVMSGNENNLPAQGMYKYSLMLYYTLKLLLYYIIYVFYIVCIY